MKFLWEVFYSEMFFSGLAYMVGELLDGACGASQNYFLRTTRNVRAARPISGLAYMVGELSDGACGASQNNLLRTSAALALPPRIV